MRLPFSIFLSVSLFTAETTAALYLSSTYHSAGDKVWKQLTLLFSLVPSMLVQLALIFFHRDLGRDRPFILLLHMLQFGPIVRCLEAFWTYGSVGRVEESYVSITRKKQMPRRGEPEEVERQVGQAEGKLVTHRAAFARTAVMQAFLGSAPQLTLQLYICVLQRGVSVGRGTLMVISLLSIVYGALRCNILAIKIKYDEYQVSMSPSAYLCIFMWRSCEIASRVVVLVLFSSVLKVWVLPVVVVNFLAFFFYPWILFWRSHSPFPQHIEKTLTHVKLSDPDLINKSQNWYRMVVYYMVRFIENASLLLIWYIYRTDFYEFMSAPLLMLELLGAYGACIFFMLVFYQSCHPCRRLFMSSMSQGFEDCCALLCLSCSSAELTIDPHKEVGPRGEVGSSAGARCNIPNDRGREPLNGGGRTA
ncbi:membrane transport protein XK isoform X2 [Hippocampus zosterae]|uniref:membrane transport protein XK isoform X2 n=1 Tax=Hippocampus zosterae TaxID=109293 RepID=UPI00223E69CD|nr:membrane transport protein XK isoform X2 [Hippocampus zosterae]